MATCRSAMLLHKPLSSICLVIVLCLAAGKAAADVHGATYCAVNQTSDNAIGTKGSCTEVTAQHTASATSQASTAAAATAPTAGVAAAIDSDTEAEPPSLGSTAQHGLLAAPAAAASPSLDDHTSQDTHAGIGTAAAPARPEAIAKKQQQQQNKSGKQQYLELEKQIIAAAASKLPAKSAADRGSYVDFLLFVSKVGNLPTLNDQHFNPIVVPVLPPSNSGKQPQQQKQLLGWAGDLSELLAKQRAQFIISVGERSHFSFLELLPAQMRRTWFHVSRPDQVTVGAIETFYYSSLRAPVGGSPSEPLLSIFTPAYKSGRKIHIPYEGLLKQNYTNWEWIVYDDSPPEHTETWKELVAIRDADPRVQIIKTDRNDGYIGSVKAKACSFASGQLLIELDHDDLLLPDALSLLRDALAANPDAGFFYTEAVELYEGTDKSVDYGASWAFGEGAHYRMLLDGAWVTGAVAPALNSKTLRHIVGIPNHVRAWRRDVYLELGGHARGLPVADDYDLVLRALFKYPAVYIRHMTYVQYRQLDGSTFTFKRNALIQRLVGIISQHSDQQIQRLLADKNMTDRGRLEMWYYKNLQDDATPTGPPPVRYYHKPTVTAPPGRPHITVVIPTYNNTQKLHSAIMSVYAQEYENWELLIVGDQCPLLDGYMQAQKQLFETGNHTVRWYNLHKRGGPGLHAPLNHAVKALAASDWIAYLKDGATWTPDHLSSLVALIADDPNRSFVFSSVQMNNKVLLADEPRLYRLDTSAMVHHRRLIEQYGAWRPRAEVGYGNDWDLFSRWRNETWGASLRPTVMYSGLPDSYVDGLINTY